MPMRLELCCKGMHLAVRAAPLQSTRVSIGPYRSIAIRNLQMTSHARQLMERLLKIL